MMGRNYSLLLASRSPRRAELLKQIGVDFEVRVADVVELRAEGETPENFVLRLAREKACCVWEQAQAETRSVAVLGADTIVTLHGEVYGKPLDYDDALSMWAKLSGATHDVYTAVTLCYDNEIHVALSKNKVSFRTLSLPEQKAYWRSGEPCDKAGGYAIQGLGAIFVKRLEGSFSGVMGLPLYETASLLTQINVYSVLDSYYE
ncbi:Septum formation protein Maf [hydrothermal vent metagenome]|uniref:Septum formation protein Maf n=1 Tax=hydrothermal vent metagenome TaxID=652676 RepID=A0A3B0Z5Q2_9ZZZZ